MDLILNQIFSTADQMKKVLIISYFFPPLGGAGIQRTLKFVQYLPKFGWMPLVLTQKGGHHYAYDHEQLDLVPKGVRIIRASSWEVVRLRFAVRRFLKRITAVVGRTKQNGGILNERELSMSKAIFPLNLLRRFIEQWMFIPDSKIRWLITATYHGLRLVRNRGVEVLYSTSYPYTCHLIGYLLKRISQKPWVADFRDPWADNAFMTRDFSTLRKKIDSWLESKVVRDADKVILNTRPTGELFVKKYPLEDKEKFIIIPNGYDLEDFQGLPLIKSTQFIVLFTGSLSPPSSLGCFLEAVTQILSDRPDIISDFKVVFVGWMHPTFKKNIKELGIERSIQLLGYVPRRVCLQMQAGASVLLLPLSKAAQGMGIYPGKIFDYLAARRPILGLLPEDIAAQLIRQTESGIVVDPEDQQAIADAILDFYNKYKEGSLSLGKRKLPLEFSREFLTRRLADVFDQLRTG
jgi:glycosyltransferase involved in cell wall biosynthesis